MARNTGQVSQPDRTHHLHVGEGTLALISTIWPMVRILVLGPLMVEVDERPVELPRGRQRLVLAALALAGGDIVSADRLVDAVWDGSPPENAVATLQVHISHLRGALRAAGIGDVIATRSPGYALTDRAVVDAVCFEQEVAEGRNARRAGRTADAADPPIDPGSSRRLVGLVDRRSRELVLAGPTRGLMSLRLTGPDCESALDEVERDPVNHVRERAVDPGSSFFSALRATLHAPELVPITRFTDQRRAGAPGRRLKPTEADDRVVVRPGRSGCASPAGQRPALITPAVGGTRSGAHVHGAVVRRGSPRRAFGCAAPCPRKGRVP